MSGYRSYEVYQRVRTGQTTEWIRPRQLSSDAYLRDPFPIVAVLREHQACYRDWPGNAFWVTRYDDVTSVFTDDANYETRSRAWGCGRAGWGHDLGGEPAVLACLERVADGDGTAVARSLAATLEHDLATEVLARFPFELLCRALDVEPTAELARWYLLLPRATGSEPVARQAALDALDALAAFVAPLMHERRHDAGRDDLLTVAARLGASAEDVAVTLLELDHATLHGALANLWFHLLTVDGLRERVAGDRLLTRAALLETLRHSPPVVSADRWTRHEVERFGRLLPEGALVRLSAAAANRDPSVFAEPDRFDVDRRDLAPREPRGQYRADGLASGISFGTGAPSKHPAVPEDRPRSRYAITRDLALRMTAVLFEERPGMRLAPGAEPSMRSLRLGEPYLCWSLPVVG